LRANGVPARLATGFATGEHDPITGRYTVRERDAHAWAEVFFPGIGWQGFDPTANVPFAGSVRANASALPWLRTHLDTLALVVVGVALLWALAGLGRRMVRGRRNRRERSWAARTLDELDRIGAKSGRPRPPAEAIGPYTEALGARLGLGELVAVGALIDADAFGPEPISDEERRSAEAVLERARDC
jgi:hypothetical protein